MPQGDGQFQPKRRTKATNIAGPEPLPLYPARSSGKPTSARYTDEYVLDQGLMDEPHSGTSVVRLDSPQTTQPQRSPGSQLSPSIPQRRPAGTTTNLPRQSRLAPSRQAEVQKHKDIHWFVPLGIGMLAMLAVWITGSWVLAWGLQRYDDIRYGTPRTYQVDAVVGHNNDSPQKPSHFIATNYNRQAIIIEFMAGDPAKSVSYVAPVYIAGNNGDLAPVTLEFRDVNGDRKPDMIIHIHLPSQDQLSVFVNDGTKFRPATAADKIHI
jgi:hypothetical protein